MFNCDSTVMFSSMTVYIFLIFNVPLFSLIFHLKGCYKEDRDSLFTSSHVEKTKGNGYKLHWEKFHLDMG